MTAQALEGFKYNDEVRTCAADRAISILGWPAHRIVLYERHAMARLGVSGNPCWGSTDTGLSEIVCRIGIASKWNRFLPAPRT